MKHGMRRAAAGLLAGLLLLTSGCSATGSTKATAEAAGFTPQLDTEAAVQLDVLGFFGNFEALDQVMNDFNQYYPNLTYSYQQVGGSAEEEYMDANPDVDLIMTSNDLLHGAGSTLAQRCVDLKEAGVDFADVDDTMLRASCIDGKQVSVPIGQNLYGVVANTTLLEQEGLTLPQNQEELFDTLAALKEKGYTPLQGPTSKVYAELVENRLFASLCEGQPLRKALEAGDLETARQEVLPLVELVDTMVSQGYTDPALNDEYPDDNYDGAILRFFEGDVPFWVCNTEKVGGMKKRESKSEAFQKNPFSYTFLELPIGEEGTYLYREPWVGFAVNKTAAHADYAVEFIRFLATRDESNRMADVKGVPSVAKSSTDPAVYRQVLAEDVLQKGIVNGGEVGPALVSSWYSIITQYVRGEYPSADEAAAAYVAACAEALG